MGFRSYDEGCYFPPQKPNCKYIIVPAHYVVLDLGMDESFKYFGIGLFETLKHLHKCMKNSREMYGLRVRRMDCPSTEAERVGSQPTLTWKMEVSYPLDDPRYPSPPSDEETTAVAKMIFPNRPECHKLF